VTLGGYPNSIPKGDAVEQMEHILKCNINVRVIVPDEERRILLVEQVPGFWIIPGGRVEATETSRQAAMREVQEESGLEVDIVRLIWCTESYSHEYGLLALSFVYLGEAIGGELNSGEQRAAFFAPSEIEHMNAIPKSILPDGSFWKLLNSNFAGYDPMISGWMHHP
jgi:ADP-ribose pyrophosphatase YjhB (NUDIX family)